jgi:hypothetical protein
MVLFIPPNIFWCVGKLDGFEKKFLETFVDALTQTHTTPQTNFRSMAKTGRPGCPLR